MMGRKTGFFLIFSLVSLFPCVLGAAEWYTTAATGIPGDSIDSGPASQGWSLSIDFNGRREIRTLYKDGAVKSVTVFVRREGRLVAREEQDSDGRIVSRIEYAYDAEGNPRAMFINIDNAANDTEEANKNTEAVSAAPLTAIISPSVPGRSGQRITQGSGEDWNFTDFDTSGRPVRQTETRNGELTGQIVWDRAPDGSYRQETQNSGGRTTRGIYDQNGQLVEQSVMIGDKLILTRRYQWRGGNLIRVEERGEGHFVVREMTWEDGRMTSETKKIDGTTVSKTQWPSFDEKIETLYSDGQAVIRVYWDDGVKRREEFLKNGQVIRVQEESG